MQSIFGRAGGWRRVLLINMGLLAGISISLFIVPQNTPLWIWVVSSLAFLVAMNYAQFAWHSTIARRTNDARTKRAVIIGLLGILFLILDLIYSRYGAR
jgi:hypothetical protein